MNITFFGIKRSEAYEKRHINNVLKKHKLLFFKEHIDEENIKKAKFIEGPFINMVFDILFRNKKWASRPLFRPEYIAFYFLLQAV